MIRVLIVDDSATMRALIAAALSVDPEFVVVGEAGDPLEARQAIKALNPDVITLDVEMPNMNGLDFLERLMRLRPMPVVMVSTLTTRGAEATLEALELGAVDCVAKPTSCAPHTFAVLPDKVRAAAQARVRPLRESCARRTGSLRQRQDRGHRLLHRRGGSPVGLVARLPAGCPDGDTQHMPATFTGSFAERLNRSCAAKCARPATAIPGAGQGLPRPRRRPPSEIDGVNHLRAAGGRAPGQRPLPVVDSCSTPRGARPRARPRGHPDRHGRDGAAACSPSASRRPHSAERGDLRRLRHAKAAFEIGAVERQLPLEKIGAAIRQLTNKRSTDAGASASMSGRRRSADHPLPVRSGLQELGFRTMCEASDGEEGCASC